MDPIDRFTFVIPVFNLHGARLENFEFILDKLLQVSSSVVVVEQVQNSKNCNLKELTEKRGGRYVPVIIDDVLIHKSKIINTATQLIDTEFVWVNDADCILNFKEAIHKIDFDNYNFIQPYKTCKHLNSEVSRKIKNNERVSVRFTPNSSRSVEDIKRGAGVYTSLYSAMSFIYKKSDFLKIGGMNEDYIGWGKEDSSLCLRMMQFEQSRFQIVDICAGHLFHPKKNQPETQHEVVKRNAEIYEEEFKDSVTNLNDRIRNFYQNYYELAHKIY